jgi:hypothetical protein
MDGAEFLRQSQEQFDFIYADAWPGKTRAEAGDAQTYGARARHRPHRGEADRKLRTSEFPSGLLDMASTSEADRQDNLVVCESAFQART